MIQTISVRKIWQLMNEASSSHTPYLFAIDYEQDQAFFVFQPLQQNELLFSFHETGNALAFNTSRPPKYSFVPIPESFTNYKHRFDIIHSAQMYGNSFLANLTLSTPLHCSLTLADIFKYAQAPFRLYIPKHFVCFSPEPFVQIDTEGHISSFPMKGTIDANIPHADQLLRSDPKERSEHYTIVDLIRNDLSQVSHNVTVERFAYLEKIKTSKSELWQMSSHIRGKLLPQFRNSHGDIFRQLLPAGSICGAPKSATCMSISEAEGRKRGFYTGVFGYYNGQTMQSAVLIRFIEQKDHSLEEAVATQGSSVLHPAFLFHSGGGITLRSNPYKEYEELIQKIYLPF